MTNLFVAFSDPTESKIIAWFASEQTIGAFPNMGEIDQSSPVWAAYYSSLPKTINEGMPAPI